MLLHRHRKKHSPKNPLKSTAAQLTTYGTFGLSPSTTTGFHHYSNTKFENKSDNINIRPETISTYLEEIQAIFKEIGQGDKSPSIKKEMIKLIQDIVKTTPKNLGELTFDGIKNLLTKIADELKIKNSAAKTISAPNVSYF